MNNYDDLLDNAPTKARDTQISKEDYAAMKKAQRNEIFALSDKIALKVAGNGDNFRQYLDIQSKFDRYSAVNVLLIMAQKADATRIGDFDYWKNKGGFVKPGQTAISILEPHEYAKEDGSAGTGYNIKKVFDISQVDTRKTQNELLPTYTERQILSALISKAPMKITGVDELPDNLCAMANPQTGEISVRKGMDFARTFSSLAQLIAAAKLSDKSDSRLESGFSDCSVSYILCKKYGVDTEIFRFDDSPNVFEGLDVQAIKGELSCIRDVAFNIFESMSRQLEANQKTTKIQEAR